MNTITRSIPAIFQGAKEYRDLPEALELAQRTFNEEEMYKHIAFLAKTWFHRHKRKPRILDLCSATGWASLRVANTIPVQSVTLVDLDQGALDKALRALHGITSLRVACEDAVTYYDSVQYDVVLMNSAYHHVEDERKVAFLQNSARRLGEAGTILVGEQFLPSYTDEEFFRQSIICFYSALLTELKKRDEPETAINVIRRSGLYCWERRYEYKVSLERLTHDLTSAGLSVASQRRVWPDTDSNPLPHSSGSFVLEVLPQNQTGH